jgi:hypothetical protein
MDDRSTGEKVPKHLRMLAKRYRHLGWARMSVRRGKISITLTNSVNHIRIASPPDMQAGAVRKAQDVQFYLGQASMDFRNNLQGAFQNLMTGRGGIKGFFSDIMGGIRQSFARIAAELLAQWAIRQLLGSAGGQGGAGGGGMGANGQMNGSQVGAAIGMAAGGPIGAAIGGALGGMLKFAGGGRPPMGRASLVGEEGPELFVPDRPGTIYPSGTGPGGAVVHQTVQIYGGINREADESRVAERIAADVQRALRYA